MRVFLGGKKPGQHPYSAPENLARPRQVFVYHDLLPFFSWASIRHLLHGRMKAYASGQHVRQSKHQTDRYYGEGFQNVVPFPLEATNYND